MNRDGSDNGHIALQCDAKTVQLYDKTQQEWDAVSSQKGEYANACNHLFLAQRGLKCTVRQILPPRYILAVLPSSSGMQISGAVTG